MTTQPFQRAPGGLRPLLLRLAIVRSCASAQDGQKRMSSDRVAVRGAGDCAPAAETNRQQAAASAMRVMGASLAHLTPMVGLCDPAPDFQAGVLAVVAIGHDGH